MSDIRERSPWVGKLIFRSPNFRVILIMDNQVSYHGCVLVHAFLEKLSFSPRNKNRYSKRLEYRWTVSKMSKLLMLACIETKEKKRTQIHFWVIVQTGFKEKIKVFHENENQCELLQSQSTDKCFVRSIQTNFLFIIAYLFIEHFGSETNN